LFNSKLNGRKLGFIIPLSGLPKDTTSELANLSSHYPYLMNVKQGSCKYQLFKMEQTNTCHILLGLEKIHIFCGHFSSFITALLFAPIQV